MNIFEKPNTANNWKCPICNSAEEKQVVLIGIDGTERENNIESEQIHVDCLDFRLKKGIINIVYCKWDSKELEGE